MEDADSTPRAVRGRGGPAQLHVRRLVERLAGRVGQRATRQAGVLMTPEQAVHLAGALERVAAVADEWTDGT